MTAILPVGVVIARSYTPEICGAWFCLDVRGIEVARQVTHQSFRLGLAKIAHHLGLRCDDAGPRYLGELAFFQPSTASGKGILEVAAKPRI